MRKVFRSVIVMGLLVAALAVASPANAQPVLSSVVIGDGRLVARGAAVDVPVTVVCTGTVASVNVELSQRVAQGRVATGFGQTDGATPCTGTEQTITVRANAVLAAFKNGAALATATVGVCDGAECTFASTTNEIRLRK
jgi:uncharacterized membrane protein